MTYDIVEVVNLQLKIYDFEDITNEELKNGLESIDFLNIEDYLYYLILTNVFLDIDNKPSADSVQKYFSKVGKQVVDLYPEYYTYDDVQMIINYKLIKQDLIDKVNDKELYDKVIFDTLDLTKDAKPRTIKWFINQTMKYYYLSNMEKNKNNIETVRAIVKELKENKELYEDYQKELISQRQISI